MQYDYDLVVIGSGPAGEKGAARAAYFGKRVAVIEKEREPGGAAVHTGTLPSKTLRETALFLSGHRQRALYGLHVSLDAALAVPKLLSRKDAVRKKEVDRIKWNLERHGVELLKGRARFVDAHTVEITGEGETRRVSGEFLLIATGSVPYHPPDILFDSPYIDDSDTILLLDSMPARMAVLGGGVIGCEYACMFAALGVKITLIEPKAELLSFLDAEVSEHLRKALVDLGADVRLNTSAAKVACPEGGGVVVSLSTGEDLALDRLLIAAGRSGCTAGLGLEEIGVKLGKRSCVEVDKKFRTSVPSIFAVGDVVGFPALASTSMEQARSAVSSAFGLEYRCESSELLPYGVYTIPEVSCVGLSEEDAKAKGMDVAVGRGLYKHNARGEICGDTAGMIKLVFDRPTRRLLGAHCVGDSATEIVHVGQAMIELKGTVETIIAMVFNYPTLSEAYKYAAYDALGRWDKEPAGGGDGGGGGGGGG